MVVWIGSTAFDGFTYRTFWQDVLGTSSGWTRTLINTVGPGLDHRDRGGCVPARRARRRARAAGGGPRPPAHRAARSGARAPRGRAGSSATTSPSSSARGRTRYALISDPFGRGWDLFGTYDHTVDYSILTAWWVPWLQLALIAVGHVASVVLLHELAMERLAPRAAMRTTWVMAAVCSASITAACMLVLT